MMIKKLFWVFFGAAGLGLSSCSSDGVESGTNTDGMGNFTVFSAQKPASGATRTTGSYGDGGIDFAWTPGDELWINAGDTLIKSSRSNISGKQASAKFYYGKAFSAPSYPVRYTGANGTGADKVIISAYQVQEKPNDASGIAVSGDCGTAVATLRDSVYTFSLEHRAAYITFLPWYGKAKLSGDVYVEQIRLTADDIVAGTFGFSDNGIDASKVQASSRTITLKLGDKFGIPQNPTPLKNAAIMVLKPGKYAKVEVEYTLRDDKTGVSGTVNQAFTNLTLNAGRNLPIRLSELDLQHFSPNYYAWDAQKPYWTDYDGALPVLDGDATGFSTSARSLAYQNDNPDAVSAENSLKNAPNANEAILYAFYGDAHWDGKTLWTMNGHLYKGGMWFLKLPYCGSGYTHPVAQINEAGHTGNYNDGSRWADWTEQNGIRWTTEAVAEGKPTGHLDRYFYLPAMGYVNGGTLLLTDSGYYGAYWTSTPVRLNTGVNAAASLHFSDTQVGVDIDNRYWAYPRFTASSLQVE